MSSSHPERDPEGEPSGPKVYDRRRIDPDTYQVREPQDAAPAPGGPTGPSTTNPQADASSAADKDSRVTELETAASRRPANADSIQVV